MSQKALIFEDPRFSDYNPQSVCLTGNRDFDVFGTYRLEGADGLELGTGEVVAYCSAPFDELPTGWVHRCHLPEVQTRYGLADQLEKHWDGFTTKTLCTIVLLDVELNDKAKSA